MRPTRQGRLPEARGCGGIGRRAGFRCLCPQGRGGSTPLIRKSRIREQLGETLTALLSVRISPKTPVFARSGWAAGMRVCTRGGVLPGRTAPCPGCNRFRSVRGSCSRRSESATQEAPAQRDCGRRCPQRCMFPAVLRVAVSPCSGYGTSAPRQRSGRRRSSAWQPRFGWECAYTRQFMNSPSTTSQSPVRLPCSSQVL